LPDWGQTRMVCLAIDLTQLQRLSMAGFNTATFLIRRVSC
jgi:hypothetical protein